MALDIYTVLTKLRTAQLNAATNSTSGTTQQHIAQAMRNCESVAPRAAVWGSASIDAVGKLLDRVGAIADLITASDQSKALELNTASLALQTAVLADDLLQVMPDPELRRLLRSKYGINTVWDLTQRVAAAVGIGITNADSTTLTTAEGIQYAVGIDTLTIRTIGATFTTVPHLGGLRKLTTLNLSSNPGLTSVPGLGMLSALTTLNLADSTGLMVSERLDALTALVTFDIHNTATSYIGSVVGWTALSAFKIHQCQFSQANLELIVDQLWANRVALGGRACAIDLRLNPGSAATATSRAVQIQALKDAGCTVSI